MPPQPPKRSGNRALQSSPSESELHSSSESEALSSEDESEDQDEEELDDAEDSDVAEKDETELALEKLVFGDSEGFREGVKSFGVETLGGDQDVDMQDAEEDVDDEVGLGGLDDADLFFMDSGPTDGASNALLPSHTKDAHVDASKYGREPAAWEDSDDERIMVSLASVPRLRKLRQTEADDVVTGKEYSRRLRLQYERLHPPPAWAQPQAPKKRRKSTAASSSDSDSDSDTLSTSLSTKPLSSLLRDASLLTTWQAQSSSSSKRRKLAPEKLSISRLKDIPGSQPSAVASLTFHPHYPLLLSSGLAKTVWLHHVHPHPPSPNPLLTSLHIRGSPIDTSAFDPRPGVSKIYLSSRRRHIHIWDVASGIVTRADRTHAPQQEAPSMAHFALSPDGKYMAVRGAMGKNSGNVHILSAATQQWLRCARIDCELADFAWWADGSGLSIVGTGGEVAEYDVENGRIEALWHDDGGLNTTCIALGGRSGRDEFCGGDRWVAIGSRSGIVNIYDRRAWATGGDGSGETVSRYRSRDDPSDDSDGGIRIPKRPKPVRVIDNLVSSISSLRFAPDGQALAIASRAKKNALRLVHLPSCTVFRNWPTQNTPLGRVTSVAWARGDILEEGGGGERGSGAPMYVLALGNDNGQIRLWEVGI